MIIDPERAASDYKLQCIYAYLNVKHGVTVLLCFWETPSSLVHFSHSQHAEHQWDVTACQMVTRSECSVWQGSPPHVWKASFLLVAGTRHACRAASVQKHPHIRGNWKNPEACGNNWLCSRSVGRARASGLTPLTLCCQHWITNSNVPRSLGILDDPNTHCVTWSPHLHHLSPSAILPPFLSSLGPLMEGWRDSRWGWFFYGGCDWNLWGMVSSLLTGSIFKAFPTLMPDTDDALNGWTDR